MKVVIRSSSLLFSILGIILQAPVTKVKKKKSPDEAESALQDEAPDEAASEKKPNE